MIISLRGSIEKLSVGEICCDVSGVGYQVHVPLQTWESLDETREERLWIHTYVREDRLDLFGFADRSTRTLFGLLLAQSGIGPKTALELCSVPRALLATAAIEDDAKLLTGIKGVGKKTAEKLLVEIRSLLEKQPDIFGGHEASKITRNELDRDAVSALQTLGYDTSVILSVLKNLPHDLESTEDRVAAALRSL